MRDSEILNRNQMESILIKKSIERGVQCYGVDEKTSYATLEKVVFYVGVDDPDDIESALDEAARLISDDVDSFFDVEVHELIYHGNRELEITVFE